MRGIAIAFLCALVYFMFGMIFLNFLMPDVALIRNASNLHCAAPDTEGDKLTCLIVDGVIPLFILAVLSTAGGIITERRIT